MNLVRVRVVAPLVAGVLLASGVLCASSLAGAEPGFNSIRSMPLIPGGIRPPNAPYGAVSCPSTSSCTAVGPWGRIVGEGNPTVVTETSGAWGVPRAIGLPVGGKSGTGKPAQLNAVSCAAVGNCLAVGVYPASGASTLPLLVEESSGTWSTSQSIAPPAGAATGSSETASLSGAACTSPGNCTIFGNYSTPDRSTHRMAAVETAGVWGPTQVLPDVPGAPSSTQILGLGVTCSDVSDCAAIGRGINLTNDTFETFVWKESAGVWAKPTQIRAPARASFFAYDLACAAATSCIAVGVDFVNRGSLPSVSLEEAGVWGVARPFTIPKLSPEATGGGFTGVACTIAICEVVGELVRNGVVGGVPVAATWSSGKWSSGGLLRGTPAGTRAANDAAFVAVSCASSSACLGIGFGGTVPFHTVDEPLYPMSASLTTVRSVTRSKAPTAVLAAPLDHGTLVSWQPPADDGGAPVKSFTATAHPSENSCVTTQLDCAIAGLVNGRSYVVTVIATTSFGTSAGSSSNAVVAGTVPTPPWMPRFALSGSTATVSWHASSAPADEPVLRYLVSALGTGDVHLCRTRGHACVLRGLVKGRTYVASITASNASGTSRPSRIRFIAR